jgi:hypothetical protein
LPAANEEPAASTDASASGAAPQTDAAPSGQTSAEAVPADPAPAAPSGQVPGSNVIAPGSGRTLFPDAAGEDAAAGAPSRPPGRLTAGVTGQP